MKKIFAAVFALVMLLALGACGSDRSNAADGAASWSKDWGIDLTAKDVTSRGMTLVCTQKGGIAEGSLETGSEFYIEKNENDTWVTVQPQTEPVWDMMSRLIPSGETVEWALDWSWLYGELGPGTYRICKTVVDFKESGASESQLYCAEFEIR